MRRISTDILSHVTLLLQAEPRVVVLQPPQRASIEAFARERALWSNKAKCKPKHFYVHHWVGSNHRSNSRVLLCQFLHLKWTRKHK